MGSQDGRKWLGSPPFKRHLSHLEGEQPYLLSSDQENLVGWFRVEDQILPSYVGQIIICDGMYSLSLGGYR